MSATAPTKPPVRRRSAVDQSAAWRPLDRIGLAFCWFLGLFACALAAAIIIYLLVQGVRYLRLDMLFESPLGGVSEKDTGGLKDPILGTVLVAGLATVIALPTGVLMGIWLSEFGKPTALARAVESAVEATAGVPSIVLALFGVIIFSQPWAGFASREMAGGIIYGRSFIAAGSMLSIVALPLIIGSTREGLQSIPAHVREAAWAVGKTKWATIRRVLLPVVRPQIVTGTMLGLGRVIGDTAIIVLLLGATLRLEPGGGGGAIAETLRGTGSTLTSFVYIFAPTGDGNQPEKAYAAAAILLLMVLALNAVVEIVARRARRNSWNG
ncbi:MAG: ABC transporter permease subunit [Actinomycetes bacterium]